MIETVFKETDWQIITSDFPAVGVYFARHNCVEPGKRAWMSRSERRCTECGDPVPDHIQALVALMIWKE